MSVNPSQVNNVLAEGNIKQGLDLQSYLQTIVDLEKKRLDNQETNIDTAYISKQRNMHLNDSYKKRYAEYLKIMCIIIIALFAFLGLVLLEANFDFIPSIFISLLMAIVIAFTIYNLAYTGFYDLYIRDMVSYDEIDSNYLQGAFMGSGVVIGYGSGFGSGGPKNGNPPLGSCVNQECCDIGTKWCPVNFQCISNANYSKSCPMDATIAYNRYITDYGYENLSKYL